MAKNEFSKRRKLTCKKETCVPFLEKQKSARDSLVEGKISKRFFWYSHRAIIINVAVILATFDWGN